MIALLELAADIVHGVVTSLGRRSPVAVLRYRVGAFDAAFDHGPAPWLVLGVGPVGGRGERPIGISVSVNRSALAVFRDPVWTAERAIARDLADYEKS